MNPLLGGSFVNPMCIQGLGYAFLSFPLLCQLFRVTLKAFVFVWNKTTLKYIGWCKSDALTQGETNAWQMSLCLETVSNLHPPPAAMKQKKWQDNNFNEASVPPLLFCKIYFNLLVLFLERIYMPPVAKLSKETILWIHQADSLNTMLIPYIVWYLYVPLNLFNLVMPLL